MTMNVRQGRAPKALDRRAADVVAHFSTTASDPAERFVRLRETCPVALQGGGGANGGTRSAWLVTRYADIVAVARDPATFGQGLRFTERRRPPLEANPPEHRAWRAVLQPFFLPKAIHAREPRVRGIAIDLIAPLVAAGGGDVATQVARPLPPQVLLDWMGQPTADWEMVKTACEAAFLQSSGDPDERRTFEEADDRLWAYARAVLADRRAEPRDPAADPVAAMLAGAIDGAPLRDDLIVGAVRLLLAAGHDSTTSAIGTCIQLVAEDRALQDMLRAEPERIPAAIEEMLRIRPPVLQMPRTVMRDTRLCDVDLEADDAMLLAFASGNRDERAFPQPDRFDPDRTPNRHLSFGTGIHTCIGNTLARQEIRVVLEELLRRSRSFTVARDSDHEFWHPYGVTALPLAIEPARDVA